MDMDFGTEPRKTSAARAYIGMFLQYSCTTYAETTVVFGRLSHFEQ